MFKHFSVQKLLLYAYLTILALIYNPCYASEKAARPKPHTIIITQKSPKKPPIIAKSQKKIPAKPTKDTMKTLDTTSSYGSVRVGAYKSYTRLVVESEIDLNIRVLKESNKVVLKFKNLEKWQYLRAKQINKPEYSSSIDGIEFVKNSVNATINIALKPGSVVIKTFKIAPSKDNTKFRFVIDLSPATNDANLNEITNAVKQMDNTNLTNEQSDKLSDFIIATLNGSKNTLGPVLVESKSKTVMAFHQDKLVKSNVNITINSIIDQHKAGGKVVGEMPFYLSEKPYKEVKKGEVIPLYHKKLDKLRPMIIIDAGHGGEDPGAIGHFSKEKNVTLKQALTLYALLKKTNKYDVKLTRSGDYFVSLKDRRDFAREHDADLFIAIHADSSPNKKASGMSIYTLSDSAKDEVAHKLIQQNDHGNVLNGVSFEDKDEGLSGLFIDLSQRASNNNSILFASLVLNNAKVNDFAILHEKYMSAGFAVLKGPDVPAVLIEIGFISNPSEEKLLNKESHHKKLAQTILNSVDQFFNAS